MKRATLFLAIVVVIAAFGVTGQAGEKPKGFTYRTLDVPGAEASFPQAINARGDVAGYYTLRGIDHAFLIQNGKFQTLAPPVPEALFTWILGISSTGVLAGQYRTPDACADCPSFIPFQIHGITWDEGGYGSVYVPGSAYTQANGINARGDVVGEVWTNNKLYGFVRAKDGTYTLLDKSEVPEDPTSWSSAYGINDHGDIAGWIGSFDTEFYAYLLRDGQLTPIRVPGSTWVGPSALNNRGEVVIACYDTGNSYVWKDRELTLVQVPDATWTQAWGINDEGTVVGIYGSADGKTHGFVATR